MDEPLDRDRETLAAILNAVAVLVPPGVDSFLVRTRPQGGYYVRFYQGIHAYQKIIGRDRDEDRITEEIDAFCGQVGREVAEWESREEGLSRPLFSLNAGRLRAALDATLAGMGDAVIERARAIAIPIPPDDAEFVPRREVDVEAVRRAWGAGFRGPR